VTTQRARQSGRNPGGEWNYRLLPKLTGAPRIRPREPAWTSSERARCDLFCFPCPPSVPSILALGDEARAVVDARHPFGAEDSRSAESARASRRADRAALPLRPHPDWVTKSGRAQRGPLSCLFCELRRSALDIEQIVGIGRLRRVARP